MRTACLLRPSARPLPQLTARVPRRSPPSALLLPQQPRLRRRLAPAAAFGRGSSGSKPSSGGSNPVTQLVNEAASLARNEVLSAQLAPEVRQAAERAIARRGCRTTVGDVAADGGLTLTQAEQALRALAADSLATLQVTEAGDILYVFPQDFRGVIRDKSLRLRLEPAFEATAAALGYLARVAFGFALFASVAIVFLALVVISSSGDQREDRRQRNFAPRVYFDLTDLLWYFDPWYYRRRRLLLAEEASQGRGMSFPEAVFSFVFGDGDPNEGHERRRWEAVGAYIQYRGGVVTAEELAPFLDLRPGQLSASRGALVADESYVLPALARLRGEPVVDPEGRILYSFPELQGTSRARRDPPARLAALEERQQLTAASGAQLLGVVALGIANLAGVLMLASALASPLNQLALARNGLAWVMGMLPWLQAYAAAFFAIPAFRWLGQRRENAAIESRNGAREEALQLLQSPDPALRSKLLAAEAAGQGQRVLSERDAVYRTDREVSRQPSDLEADGFERRLADRERKRQKEQQRQQQQDAPPPPQEQQRQPERWW